ncbi:MAG: sulfotransferase domain-containing protein [Xenococcaceae cyanobacterium]
MKKINQDIIQQLKYIKISTNNLSLKNFPDFLVLGPQRTGTTWLCENLRLHPQVFFTEPREIFFFNYLQRPNSPGYQSNDLAWYLNFYKETPKKYVKKNLIMLKKYGEFYRPKVRGEGTASYAVLSKEIIQEIIALNSDIKAILMIRNPVMRAWAHAKKDLLNERNKNLSEVSDREFEDFFSNSYQIKCGHYTSMIETWSSGLKENHLFIGFFDDISEKPEELLLQVFEFLDISVQNKYITSLAKKRIQRTDRSEKRELPQKYRVLLEEIFQDELVRLEQIFNRVLTR